MEKVEENTDTVKEEKTVFTESAENKDFYAVLGIPKSATEKQISSAYKKLALKYHPDRNQDNAEADVMFKSVSEAYHVLIDPNKRRQYDIGGEKAAPTEFESVDVSSLGGIGRVFGAMISRLGVPIATQIAQDIIETAHNICRNGGLEGGGPPLDPRVSDLAWGWAIEGKVDRQNATYYRVNVDSRHVENGFVLLCRSSTKGKFKVILFDGEGSVLFQEESAKSRDQAGKREITQAALYFTNFDTYRLGEASLASLQDKETPPVFSRLESFGGCKHQIAPGQYLACVYGDNFIGKTHFNIIAVQAKNDANEVSELEEADEALLESKVSLEALRGEYQQTKAAFESVVARMKLEGDKVDATLQTREKAYSGFFEASIREFSPAASATFPGHETNPSHSPAADSASTGDASSTDHAGTAPSYGSAAFTAAASAATTATAVGANAAATATAAGGWLARRFSLGLQSIVKTRTASEDISAAAEAEAARQDTAHVSVTPEVIESVVTGASESVVLETKEESSDVSAVSAAVLVVTSESVEVETSVAESSPTDAAVESASTVPAEESGSSSPTITRPTIRAKKEKKTEA